MRSRVLTAVTAVAVGLCATALTPAAAQASADKCSGKYVSQSCVGVNGTKLHVNWIKSRIDVYAFTCEYGHSQVLINGAHLANSPGWDKNWCVSGYPGKVFTTGTWNVDTDYPKGTEICSKFWDYNGTGPTNGYVLLGNACATVG